MIVLQNRLLSNINDNGDNNEKTEKLKMWVGLFEVMGGNIPCGNYLGRNFPEGNLPWGSLIGWNFLGGSFPDTTFNV